MQAMPQRIEVRLSGKEPAQYFLAGRPLRDGDDVESELQFHEYEGGLAVWRRGSLQIGRYGLRVFIEPGSQTWISVRATDRLRWPKDPSRATPAAV